MRYWWVNQNQTYRHKVTGGYLWSPIRDQARREAGERRALPNSAVASEPAFHGGEGNVDRHWIA
jgi:hypothetical protein